MPSRSGQAVTEILSEDVAGLLDSASEMLGAAILLKSQSHEQAFGAIPPPRCPSCRPAGADGSHECEARRDLALRNIGNPTEYEHWIGPCGCEVTVVAVPQPDGSPLGLVAVRSSQAAGSHPIGPAEAVRFLSRLARVAAGQLSMAHEHARTTKKLTQTREELDLLTTISGRLGEEMDTRLAIERVLAQACRATGADAAIVHIVQRKIIEVATSEAASIRLPSNSRTWRRLAERVSNHFHTQNRRFFVGSELDLSEDAPLFPRRDRFSPSAFPSNRTSWGSCASCT